MPLKKERRFDVYWGKNAHKVYKRLILIKRRMNPLFSIVHSSVVRISFRGEEWIELYFI